MTQYKRIGIDTSKTVFTVHGIDQEERPVLRINLRRAQMMSFFEKLLPTVIALEACGGSHYWARELTALGHTVRLIPPQYVKPYVKRGKNDRNDAEAIREAAGRPGMHFVPAKSVTRQAQGMVLKVRETLIGQRTALINTVRGHAAEFGLVAGNGAGKIVPFLSAIEQEAAIPPPAFAGAGSGQGNVRPSGSADRRNRRSYQRRRRQTECRAQSQRDQPAFGHHAGRRPDYRTDAGRRDRP
jgi:transposase